MVEITPRRYTFSGPSVDPPVSLSGQRWSVSQKYDCSFVSSCIEECESKHLHCHLDRSIISDLKLIDVETGSIVDYDGQPYVGLSYVWGDAASHCPAFHRVLPSDLPRVVLDTMTVVRDLGLRHLWIDKYCIEQNDEACFAHQIRQMGRIYRTAELTIIVTAGHDENYGLPGVSSTSRQKFLSRANPRRIMHGKQRANSMLSLKSFNSDGSMDTTSTISDIHYAILHSKWATRGWTYQEGGLSRRRLAFTDEQMYFECEEMCRCEAIPREDLQSALVAPIFQILNPKTCTMYDEDYKSLLESIERFTQRELRYDEDSIRAIEGVIEHYQSVDKSLEHVFGIPFLSLTKDEVSHWDRHYWLGQIGPQLRQVTFPYALGWKHTHSSWERPEHSPRRRSGFPSWSWAGWAGDVSFDCVAVRLPNYAKVAHKIRLELPSGETIQYREYYRQFSPLERRLLCPTALVLHSISVPGKLLELNFSDSSFHWELCGMSAAVSVSQGWDSPTRFCERLKQAGGYDIIILGGNDFLALTERTVFLILKQDETDCGTWTRIGRMSVACGLQNLMEKLEEHVDLSKERAFRII